jgi:hypothetical protein
MKANWNPYQNETAGIKKDTRCLLSPGENLSLVGCSPAEPTSVSVHIAKFNTTNYIYNLQNFPTTYIRISSL